MTKLLVEAFHIPAAVAEIHRQPVEQFRMARARSHNAKILGGFYDARPKYFLPHSVDCNPCGQRIAGTDGPFCQPKPVRRRTGRKRRQEMRNSGVTHARYERCRLRESACRHTASPGDSSLTSVMLPSLDSLSSSWLSAATWAVCERTDSSRCRKVEIADDFEFVLRPFGNRFLHDFRDIVFEWQPSSLVGCQFAGVKAEVLKRGLPQRICIGRHSTEGQGR